jgi:hypothetical protein
MIDVLLLLHQVDICHNDIKVGIKTCEVFRVSAVETGNIIILIAKLLPLLRMITGC